MSGRPVQQHRSTSEHLWGLPNTVSAGMSPGARRASLQSAPPPSMVCRRPRDAPPRRPRRCLSTSAQRACASFTSRHGVGALRRTCPSLRGPCPAAGRSATRPARRGCWSLPGPSPARWWGPKGSSKSSRRLRAALRRAVTLACADGFGASRYGGHYQRQGVEVIAGPVDWPAWCADRRYHYSHVLVSDEGLTTHLWQLVRATQPQAMAVLYSERLPFRRAQALGDASWHTEGTETVAEIGQTRLLHQVEGLQAAWCASAADASLLAGLGPELEVSRFGAPTLHPGAAKGYADREGVVLVATDNFDVSGDPEEPVVRALEELVPAWRRRDMSLRVKIVSDWPTPGLVEAAGRFGAEVVPSGGDLVGALGTARLALSPVNHGTSVSSWAPLPWRLALPG